MIKLEHLLVATDFSACSKEALDHAIQLALRMNGRMTLLHIFESPFFYPAETSLGSYPEVYQWLQDFKQEELKKLHILTDEIRKKDLPVEPIFKEGVPSVEIIQTAKEVGADLIVMGTHGRKGLSHVVMGSVAERVAREAPCPVFIVREKRVEQAAKNEDTVK
ncbi:MAG: universal stress protein [Candidatus Manganitrophus sp. SA1]|nr:universal stress protein [Candidatus Manganitrophus morganii]